VPEEETPTEDGVKKWLHFFFGFLAPDFLVELTDDFFRALDFLEAEAEDLFCFLAA
jgi:hypothetical protein